jgi:hypothetical protein
VSPVNRKLWLLGVVPIVAFSTSVSAAAHSGAHPAPPAAATAPSQTPSSSGPWAYGPNGHMAPNCASSTALCTEIADWHGSFPYYVGHDEPSVLFYSNQPGAGNQMTYQLTLPSDPGNPTDYSLASTSNTYNLFLHPAFWFGMVMCDTQSYPQQRLSVAGNATDPSLCPPDSDANITPDTFAGLSSHAGVAYMEMQFYPPGDNHQPDAVNPCLVGQGPGDNQWCAALNIDSFSEDPIHGTELNSTCQSVVGSIEYVNFGIVTTDGTTPGPANPVDSTQATYDGSPAHPTFFMNNGDRLQVTFNDIPDSNPGPNGSGLQVVINDLTSGTSGRMVASSSNGFGMVQYAPSPSTACNSILYNFHPMYSTSSPSTRAIWAAHSYNIAYADEIGHGEYCSNQVALSPPQGTSCNPQGLPGITESDGEASDTDDNSCFPPSAVGTIPITRCIATNGGFDGIPYQSNRWPTGETPSATVPTPIQFSSPLTGGSDAAHDTIQYSDAAFEADLPRIEAPDIGGGTKNTCQRFAVDDNGNPIPGAGSGCILIPLTDESVPASAYPWFNSYTTAAGCVWQEGQLPGNGTTINDFGQNNQYAANPFNAYGYGQLYPTTYLDGNGTTPASGTTMLQVRLQNFHHDLFGNPCPAPLATGPVVAESPSTPLLAALGSVTLLAAAAAAARRRRRRPAR